MKTIEEIIDEMREDFDKVSKSLSAVKSAIQSDIDDAVKEANSYHYDVSELPDIIYVIRTEYELGDKCDKCNSQRMIQVDTVVSNRLRVCDCGVLREHYYSKPIEVKNIIDSGDIKHIIAVADDKKYIYRSDMLCDSEDKFVDFGRCFTEVYFTNADLCEQFCTYLSSL